MAPIRVGFIGLGKHTNLMSLGAWGALAHLPSLLASPHYEIVALCNSSVESASASIEAHKLGPKVKAYGSPEDIANDPDVDLILCSVVVTKHYELIKPALLAGKDVFVEWPLAATLAQTEELATIAKEKNLKTIVGAQARADPLVIKLKELIDSGKIGTVLSSTVIGSIAGLPKAWPEEAAYYLDITSGGNTLTIFFGHLLDSFIHVLGNFESFNSILKVDNPVGTFIREDGTTYQKSSKTSPDQILVQGTLNSGVLASLTYRTTPAGMATGDGVKWIITGTEGEIELTTPESMWQMGPPGAELKLKTPDGKIEVVDFADKDEKEYVSAVAPPGTNSARAWEAFATGKRDRYPDFEDALEGTRVLNGIIAGHL